MMPFAAFRRWFRTKLVNRAIRLLTLSTIPAVVGIGLTAAENPKTTTPQPAVKAVPAKVKVAVKVETPASDTEPTVVPSKPFVKLFSSLIGGAEEIAKPAVPVKPAGATPAASEPATHTRQSEFLVKGHDDKGWLQAFAVDSQGRLLAAVGSRATYGIATANSAPSTREVQVFSAEGKSLEHWPVDFDPQRIAIGPKDEVFVAGSGKIARFNQAGKLISQSDSPHIAAVLGDADALRDSAEQQRKQMVVSYGEALKSIEQQKGQLEKRIATLEEQATKAADEAKKAVEEKNDAEKSAADESSSKKARKAAKTADDTDKPRVAPTDRTSQQSTAIMRQQLTALKRQLTQNEAQVKQYRQVIEQQENRSIDDIIQEIKQRLQKINAIAVSDDEVFITTGIAKGYGFAVWRTDLELQNPKQIISNLSGCCGQMDVNVIGGEVFIAENSRHRVGRYDRDGKLLTAFGSRERESAGACFGGCCNPMNVCLGPNGTVLTSESEGFVKSFQPDGTFVGLIGKAQVSGGCKNVSIATSPDGDRVYFYDLEKSRVVVMAREKPSDETKPAKTASKD